MKRFLYFIRVSSNKTFVWTIKALRNLTGSLFIVLNQIIGTVPTLIRAHFILDRKYKKLFEDDKPANRKRLSTLPLEHLEEYYNDEMGRLKQIEDKARSLFLGITMAVSLVGVVAFVPLNSSEFDQLIWAQKAQIVLPYFGAITFFLLGGFLSILAASVGAIAQLSIEDHISLIEESEIKTKLVSAIEQNEIRILQKAN